MESLKVFFFNLQFLLEGFKAKSMLFSHSTQCK